MVERKYKKFKYALKEGYYTYLALRAVRQPEKKTIDPHVTHPWASLATMVIMFSIWNFFGATGLYVLFFGGMAILIIHRMIVGYWI